jgi:hypothetical protein
MRSLLLTTGSGLYCVWVRVYDNGRDRLISIWIDSAANRWKSQLERASGGIEPAATSFPPQERNDVNPLDVEELHNVLPFCR